MADLKDDTDTSVLVDEFGQALTDGTETLPSDGGVIGLASAEW
jgi:hypothetical protein